MKEYNTIAKCIACGLERNCREEVMEHEGKQEVVFFCEECDKEIEDTIRYYGNPKDTQSEGIKMNNIAVYKLNEYEWYVTPWNLEKTKEWYKKEFDDEVDECELEKCDIDEMGMWYPTDSKEDIDKLGDLDSITSTVIKDGKRTPETKFGDLMKSNDSPTGFLKFVSFRTVIEKDYKGELKEPECIASSEW